MSFCSVRNYYLLLTETAISEIANILRDYNYIWHYIYLLASISLLLQQIFYSNKVR